jgi:hypothetical protein
VRIDPIIKFILGYIGLVVGFFTIVIIACKSC